MTFLIEYICDTEELENIVILNRSLQSFTNLEFKGLLVAKDKKTKVYLADCGGLYLEIRKGSRIIAGYIGSVSEFDYYISSGALSLELYQELKDMFEIDSLD